MRARISSAYCIALLAPTPPQACTGFLGTWLAILKPALWMSLLSGSLAHLTGSGPLVMMWQHPLVLESHSGSLVCLLPKNWCFWMGFRCSKSLGVLFGS